MPKRVDTAKVMLWKETVGAISWLEDHEYGLFEFDPQFLQSGLEVSPIHMGLQIAAATDRIFTFPTLNKKTFHGLPGLLADALPDKFGHQIIDTWLARQGRDPMSFTPIERLCYTGQRGMGALQFHPPQVDHLNRSVAVEINELAMLAQKVVSERMALDVHLSNNEHDNADALLDILRVGTSAGGARPKAVIALDEQGHVVSGQTQAPPGYEYWLLKFDGVSDFELGKPRDYGRIEYAYYLMAQAAGIHMSECRLLEENGRAHFLTKRFDRIEGGSRHMQTLCGIAHYDYNAAGAYGYEQAFSVMRKLRLNQDALQQQYLRMVFNIVARNQDDHTKNISFLMDDAGIWSLSPAYDVIYSHNPHGQWTNQHQMSVNGKRDHFSANDLLAAAQAADVTNPDDIICSVVDTIAGWPEFAKEAGLPAEHIKEIAHYHRLTLRV